MPPDAPAGIKQLEQMIVRLINVSVALGFLAMTSYVIWSGIKYLTSAGDQKALAAAHQSMTWALIGAVFLVIAWIVLLAVRSVTGVDVTKFCISFDPCT